MSDLEYEWEKSEWEKSLHHFPFGYVLYPFFRILPFTPNPNGKKSLHHFLFGFRYRPFLSNSSPDAGLPDAVELWNLPTVCKNLPIVRGKLPLQLCVIPVFPIND